jgi:hypothetical protein
MTWRVQGEAWQLVWHERVKKLEAHIEGTLQTNHSGGKGGAKESTAETEMGN